MEEKSKVVVLCKAPSPGAGCCKVRETGASGKSLCTPILEVPCSKPKKNSVDRTGVPNFL